MQDNYVCLPLAGTQSRGRGPRSSSCTRVWVSQRSSCWAGQRRRRRCQSWPGNWELTTLTHRTSTMTSRTNTSMTLTCIDRWHHFYLYMNSFLHLNVDIEWLDVYIGLCLYFFIDILYGVYWSPHCTSFSPTKRFFATDLYLSVNIQKTFLQRETTDIMLHTSDLGEGERIRAHTVHCAWTHAQKVGIRCLWLIWQRRLRSEESHVPAEVPRGRLFTSHNPCSKSRYIP